MKVFNNKDLSVMSKTLVFNSAQALFATSLLVINAVETSFQLYQESADDDKKMQTFCKNRLESICRAVGAVKKEIELISPNFIEWFDEMVEHYDFDVQEQVKFDEEQFDIDFKSKDFKDFKYESCKSSEVENILRNRAPIVSDMSPGEISKGEIGDIWINKTVAKAFVLKEVVDSKFLWEEIEIGSLKND